MLQVDVPLSDGSNQIMEESRAVGEEVLSSFAQTSQREV